MKVTTIDTTKKLTGITIDNGLSRHKRQSNELRWFARLYQGVEHS